MATARFGGLFLKAIDMKYKVIKAFDWAHRGIEIERFELDAQFETDDADLILVGTSESWIELIGSQKRAVVDESKSSKRQSAAMESAPEPQGILQKAKKTI